MARTEDNVEKMLEDACAREGIKCVKGNSKNNKGFPDRTIFHTGKKQIYYVEIKNQTYYKQQRTQKNWQDRIEQSGGNYFLIDGAVEMKRFIIGFIDFIGGVRNE